VTSFFGLKRLDHQSNTTIREELKVEHTVDEIQNYQKNWLQHVNKVEHAGIPRMTLEYQPKGKRAVGRPKRSWRDHQRLQH
jgi:hypothetical protein